MGLFKKRIKNPIDGTANVVGSTLHSGEGAFQNCRMQLVVTVEGRQPYAVEVSQLAPRKKWPQPGLAFPVIVSKDDPQKVRIDFDSAPTSADRAREIAEQQAASVSNDPPNAASTPGVQIVTGNLQDIAPEPFAQLEQMLGMDVDGDGVIGPHDTAESGVGGDRVTKLERLAKLRSSGALTDDEFESEKRRILDS